MRTNSCRAWCNLKWRGVNGTAVFMAGKRAGVKLSNCLRERSMPNQRVAPSRGEARSVRGRMNNQPRGFLAMPRK